MYSLPALTSIGRIWPGTRVAKATIPGADLAVYSVTKKLPPATARFTAPKTPVAPAFPVAAVPSSIDDVIQDNSPDSATTDSPVSSFISSTGRTVPIT
jgi:hypothetical protein